MPVYEYGCIECETRKEIPRKITDEEVIPRCEKCGNGMARVYTPFGINLKGSGFYSTDNRKP